jgi:hypothetical protein
MALKRLKQAMATLSSDVRRDIHIFIAAIVFLGGWSSSLFGVGLAAL